MPRQLPWLKDGSASAAEKRTPKPTKRQRLQTPDLDEDNTTGVSTPQRKRRANANRTPSTSPPPSPPREEFMREGLAADDIWIMVEDEFLETAKLFTQHLHHAEYKRLKDLAKAQNATAISNLSRPVDGRTPLAGEAKRRVEAETRLSAQKAAVQGVTGRDSEDEDDAPYMRDPCLAGLMMGRNEPTASLASVAGSKSNTRAAAGYLKTRPPSPRWASRQQRDEGLEQRKPREKSVSKPKLISPVTSEADDEDLDAPPRPRTSHESSTRQATLVGANKDTLRTVQAKRPPDRTGATRKDIRSNPKADINGNDTFSTSSNRPSISTSKQPATQSSMTKISAGLDAFDFPKRHALPSGVAERMAKRKVELAKQKNDDTHKSVSLNEIPTFLV
ncbi:hypothetical protein H2201_001311 [Coniosporium apollinis]|uniref:Uncharacterized protein n=2 Tax=Coniosporium TaxID=2810619 RepID=A0ABQ9P325_9PEZI|nr:hypothetical protein H2199_001721 [Cladosporium sp. JES 115]KAJ9668668.1 hypothetical protein H2201_001311 [Coniosporium apollinis]